MAVLSKLRQFADDPMLRSMVLHGATALIIKVLAAGLSFIMFVVIANALSPAEFGKFAFGFSLAITLSTIAGLGLGTAILRFVPQYQAQKSDELARGFFTAASIASLVFPIAIAMVMASAVYFLQAQNYIRDGSYLYATAAFVPIMALSEFSSNALRATGLTLIAMAPKDVVWRALVSLLAIIIVWFGLRFDGGQFMLLCTFSLIVVFLGQIFLGRKTLLPMIQNSVRKFDVPLWIKTTWPMWGSATVFAFVQQFDVVILGFFLSPEQSGPYFAALRTASMLGLLLIAGNLISAPLIARYHHAGDHAALQKMVKMLTAGIAVPTIVGFGLLALMGGWLLSWFDESFVSAYPILLILGLGFMVDAVAGPTGYMLQMIGRELTYLKIMTSAYALTLILQCLLIPYLGPIGAAIPNALGLIFANVILVRTIKREIGLDPSLFGLFQKS